MKRRLGCDDGPLFTRTQMARPGARSTVHGGCFRILCPGPCARVAMAWWGAPPPASCSALKRPDPPAAAAPAALPAIVPAPATSPQQGLLAGLCERHRRRPAVGVVAFLLIRPRSAIRLIISPSVLRSTRMWVASR